MTVTIDVKVTRGGPQRQLALSAATAWKKLPAAHTRAIVDVERLRARVVPGREDQGAVDPGRAVTRYVSHVDLPLLRGLPDLPRPANLQTARRPVCSGGGCSTSRAGISACVARSCR
jgi:hypothetical protein